MPELPKKAYVVAVDMGYGHQRAVFPLVKIAATPEEWHIKNPTVISANNYPGIPMADNFKWEETRKIYEWISRVKGFPFFGKRIFNLMSYVQKIEPFYPRRDLSKPTSILKQIYKMIERGFGRHLIETLNKNPLPIICSFPLPAFFAEEHNYKGEIFCLCTDSDIARSWAPLCPQKSRITYFAPTVRVKERLKQYGVRPEKIVVSGFPLPEEALGDRVNHNTLLSSLARRISKLDPEKVYQKKNEKLLSLYLGDRRADPQNEKPLTITFAIGGAGAQWEIAVALLKSLKEEIKSGKIKLNLVAGTSKKILRRFEKVVKRLSLDGHRGKNVSIIYRPEKFEYFKEFNEALADTDILWTKPSELSFYVGLGLPVIMSPALGSQEECNQAWLHMIGAGFEQYEPRYANEWLFDWLKSGWLAQAAMNGFLNAPKRAAEHIENLALRGERSEIEDIHFI